MKTIDTVVWMAMRGGLWLAAGAYNIKAHGLDCIDKDKAALFAIKHSSNLDGPVMLYLLPKKPVTLVTKGVFTHPVTNYLLETAGMVPINSPVDHSPAQTGIDTATFRTLYKTLNRDGFGMYAPEGTRILGSVGRTVYPELLMKVAKRGHNTYLVGIRYGSTFPWLSFVRFPWRAGIEVRIEPYDARNKELSQVTEEVKQAFAKLSGLEQKLGAPLPAGNYR